MAWVIKKSNSSPALYLKVDVNGLFAYDIFPSSAMQFADQASAVQLGRVIIDATEPVDVG